jgi:hypothetical protein
MPADPVRVDAPTLQDRLVQIISDYGCWSCNLDEPGEAARRVLDLLAEYRPQVIDGYEVEHDDLIGEWMVDGAVATPFEGVLLSEVTRLAERLDTLEAQLAAAEQGADAVHEALSESLRRMARELLAARGQVTQAVNIVHARLDTARLYAAGAATEAVRDSWTHVARVVEGLLDAFAAAGLPVGGETPEEETDA